MKPKVTIVDYGLGNLYSVCRAFEYCGADILVSDDPQVIQKSDSVVLPGVGAFASGVRGLKANGLFDAIKDHSVTGKPMLGICLGMQLLATVGEEFESCPGLDIVPGAVCKIPAKVRKEKYRKLPNVGWVPLCLPLSRPSWSKTILSEISPGDSVYVVHSYHFKPESDTHRLADYCDEGLQICAAIQKENVYGCQFHPEKSGETGLRIITKFLRA